MSQFLEPPSSKYYPVEAEPVVSKSDAESNSLQ
jgi:hypothetical protein